MGNVYARRICRHVTALPLGSRTLLWWLEQPIWRLYVRTNMGVLLVYAEGFTAGLCDDVDTMDTPEIPCGSTDAYMLEYPHTTLIHQLGFCRTMGTDILNNRSLTNA